MIKLLITGLIIYFIYRYFIAPPAIDKTGQKQELHQQNSQGKGDDGEYIDYEEVD